MIQAYRSKGDRLVLMDLTREHLRDALWIDLDTPTPAEEDAVEAALGIDIPTREDMQEIEISSRIYRENGVLYLTAQIVATLEARATEIGPVTFVVCTDRLVTVHYHHPGSLKHFADWAARHDTALGSGVDAAVGLLDSAVDRLADILEGEARKLDHLSNAIFAAHRPAGKGETLAVVLQRIGRAEDLNGKVSESLGTIQRMVGYLSVNGEHPDLQLVAEHERPAVRSLAQDVRSLREVTATHSDKIRFLLDATLGVINIRQSDVIKIFSVVAFVFLPPTLIASIYGMNFEVMPELTWPWGYPMALGMMVVSALVPYLFFRWKKWL
jgi:magnesium transporter